MFQLQSIRAKTLICWESNKAMTKTVMLLNTQNDCGDQCHKERICRLRKQIDNIMNGKKFKDVY